VDVDVRTTPDERGVGAMVDATVAEGGINKVHEQFKLLE